MSARAFIVSASTVVGLGAVLILNPAEAEPGGGSPAGIEQSSNSQLVPAPQGNISDDQQPMPPPPPGPRHFEADWSDDDGWEGTWDDQPDGHRRDGRRHPGLPPRAGSHISGEDVGVGDSSDGERWDDSTDPWSQFRDSRESDDDADQSDDDNEGDN